MLKDLLPQEFQTHKHKGQTFELKKQQERQREEPILYKINKK